MYYSLRTVQAYVLRVRVLVKWQGVWRLCDKGKEKI